MFTCLDIFISICESECMHSILSFHVCKGVFMYVRVHMCYVLCVNLCACTCIFTIACICMSVHEYIKCSYVY